MCRTKLAVIATYNPLELVQIPSSELDVMRHRKLPSKSSAEEPLIDKELEKKVIPVEGSTETTFVNKNKDSFSDVEALLSSASESQGVNEVMAALQVETELCWVARVNGPKGMIIDYLTVDDLKRNM